MSQSNNKALQLIRQYAHRLRPNTSADYDPILAAIGNARIVMIGEASHGIDQLNHPLRINLKLFFLIQRFS